jgi:hypothetical protein
MRTTPCLPGSKQHMLQTNNTHIQLAITLGVKCTQHYSNNALLST